MIFFFQSVFTVLELFFSFSFLFLKKRSLVRSPWLVTLAISQEHYAPCIAFFFSSNFVFCQKKKKTFYLVVHTASFIYFFFGNCTFVILFPSQYFASPVHRVQNKSKHVVVLLSRSL